MRKSHLISIVLILFFSFSFAQKNEKSEIIKELIAIQTLISENRISDLSDFLDKYSYMANDDGSIFIRMNFDLDSQYSVSFSIDENENGKYLMAAVLSKDREGNTNYKPTKSQRNYTWSNLLPNLEDTQPWFLYNSMRDKIKNGEIDGVNPESIEFVSEGKYKYKYKFDKEDKDAEWKYHSASNFTTMLSDDNFFRYTFFGPGKVSFVQFIFPKNNDVDSNEKAFPYFYVTSDMTGNFGDISGKSNINIDFFMSLNNLDDVIWSDAIKN